MNDPKRLLAHDSDRVTRLLLEAGRAESPGRPRLARITTAVAGTSAALSAKAAASTTMIAAAPLAGGSVTSLAVVVKWLGLGALSGLMISATASQIQPGSSDAESSRAVPASGTARFGATPKHEVSRPSPTSAWASPERSQAKPREPAPISEQTGTVPPATSASGAKAPLHRSATRRILSSERPPTPSDVPPETPASPSDALAVESKQGGNEALAERALREEVAALARAKSALNDGSGGAALEALRAYRVRYPQGRLAPEATYIEMEAALLSGDVARAVRIAERLGSGTTPSAKRAREILERK